MAAGRPTVLAIDGVIRKVVKESGGGIFVQPGNPVALANAVRDLSSDPGRAQKMGTKARAYVETHFNRQKHAQDFLELWLNMADAGIESVSPDKVFSLKI